jgi:hypothetical protein
MIQSVITIPPLLELIKYDCYPRKLIEKTSYSHSRGLIAFYLEKQQTDLLVTKTFTQNDFLSFPDKNLKPSNLQLKAQTTTTVHAEGLAHWCLVI